MKPPFKPLRQTRAYLDVLAQIREAILTGTYPPGSKLPSERELTEQFQVSRVVIREAIRALELSGFVRIRQGPYGGAYIEDLSSAPIVRSFLDLFMANKFCAEELIQARLLMEPEVARLAAARLDECLAKRLKEAFLLEKRGKPTDDQWVRQNLEVHYILALMSGNRLYEAILASLLALTHEIVRVVKPPHQLIHNHEEHGAIVEAVLSGDPDTAALAMKEHLRSVGHALVRLERQYREKTGRMGLSVPSETVSEHPLS